MENKQGSKEESQSGWQVLLIILGFIVGTIVFTFVMKAILF